MKPAPFSMLKPRSIDEAVRQLAEVGDSGKVLAGGQSLIPLLNLRLARVDVIIDIGDIESLRNISFDETDVPTLNLGSGTRHDQIAGSSLVADKVPLLARAASLIGHSAIRSRGTIGGSIAHSDPMAEYPLVLLALGAHVIARSVRGVRSIPFEELLDSVFTTTLAEDEIITAVEVPVPPGHWGWGMCEHARRPGDFAIAAAAVLLEVTDGLVSAVIITTIGHPDGPVRHDDVAQSLIGKPLDNATIQECANGISTRSAVLADSAYSTQARRRILATVVVEALEEARMRSELQGDSEK